MSDAERARLARLAFGRRRVRLVTVTLTLASSVLAALLSVVLAQGASSAATTTVNPADPADPQTASNQTDGSGQDQSQLQGPDQAPAGSDGGQADARSGGS